MKKFRAIIFLAALAACGGKKTDEPIAPRRSGEPSYSAMTGKSMIVGKPTLVRMGLKPLEAKEARGYMNSVFNELLPDLEKTNITYQMAGNDIILTIQAHLVLEDGKIREYIRPQLENFAKTLVKNDRTFVEFRGFTSSVGNKSANLRRSLAEAQEVAEFFLERGVAGERVFIAGMGESMWIADNSTREGRLLNSRIEVRIAPLI
ncbi:MAG: OmpA family protein [Rickettsiales bacterium]|jgi:outer membrane protein OmpA-like peptidoglycan-associated protein|nr:OmpA family protein [Rickettsiales bacterium]